MVDTFIARRPELSVPASNAVSPTLGTDLDFVSRALYVGTGGDVEVIMAGGDTVTFTGVPSGTILPVRVRQVTANTTAQDVLSVW